MKHPKCFLYAAAFVAVLTMSGNSYVLHTPHQRTVQLGRRSPETFLALYNNIDPEPKINNHKMHNCRRKFLQESILLIAAAASSTTIPVVANAAPLQDSLDIENFLRTGMDTGGNMGVSSQTGKSRPVTGVVFRDGSDVLQDRRSGSVSAELLTGTKANPSAVLIRFDCPNYKLENGPVFDVECRDARTGDGVFVAVTPSTNGKPIDQVPTSIILERLFSPTGRFSFYGPPTDVKIKKDWIVDTKRYIELNFSNLSQSTQAEIPRKALVVATIPQGTDNAILLVGSATANRWKKAGAEETIKQIVDSFQAIPAPKTNLKLRSKDRTGGTGLGDIF